MDNAPKDPTGSAISDVVEPLWRRKWPILATVVLATATSYLVSSSRADRYEATSGVLVQTSTVQGILGQPPLTTPERASADQAHLVASREVATRVIERLGLQETADGLVGNVTGAAVSGSNIVTLTAERPTAASAAQVANAFALEFIDLGREQIKAEIDRAIEQARARLRTLPATTANAQQRALLRDAIARLRAAEAVLPPQGRLVEVARPPASPLDPRPERDALFALIISALFAVTLTYALERYGRVPPSRSARGPVALEAERSDQGSA